MNLPNRYLEEYRKVGIDPDNPDPDGSDYHLMDVIDRRIAEELVSEVDTLIGSVTTPPKEHAIVCSQDFLIRVAQTLNNLIRLPPGLASVAAQDGTRNEG